MSLTFIRVELMGNSGIEWRGNEGKLGWLNKGSRGSNRREVKGKVSVIREVR